MSCQRCRGTLGQIGHPRRSARRWRAHLPDHAIRDLPVIGCDHDQLPGAQGLAEDRKRQLVMFDAGGHEASQGSDAWMDQKARRASSSTTFTGARLVSTIGSGQPQRGQDLPPNPYWRSTCGETSPCTGSVFPDRGTEPRRPASSAIRPLSRMTARPHPSRPCPGTSCSGSSACMRATITSHPWSGRPWSGRHARLVSSAKTRIIQSPPWTDGRDAARVRRSGCHGGGDGNQVADHCRSWPVPLGKGHQIGQPWCRPRS